MDSSEQPVDGALTSAAPTPATRDWHQLLVDSANHPLIRSLPQDFIVVFDHDLRYLAAGGLGLGAVGLSTDAMMGNTVFDVFPPDTASEVARLYRMALRGEPSVVDVPYLGRIYEQHLAPVTDEAGVIIAGMGVAQEVTAARRNEEALRESEARFRLTFAHAPIGKALVELDGTFREANQALTRLLGYSEQELLAMSFQQITHPDDLATDLDQLAQLLAGQIDSYAMEKRYLTASGAIVWVQLSVTLTRDAYQQPLYFIAQIQDVTERKRQEASLRDLVAILSHDLRTPLSVVGGYSDVLLDSWDDYDDEQRLGFLRKARAAAYAAQTLLEDTLTISALDADGIEVRSQEVRVDELAREVLATLDREHRIDTSGLMAATALVDHGHLQQVLTNLVTNALKYGGETSSIGCVTAGDRVTVRMRDTGPGVAADFVPHLFERFSRSDDARSSGKAGTGLGLYIVRRLLEVNGGGIAYSDTPGGGATFTVDLPRA